MKLAWPLVGPLVLSVVGATTLGATHASGTGDHASPVAQHSATTSLSSIDLLWGLTAPQQVQPGTVLVARSAHHGRSRGTRSDKQFFEISTTGSNDVPAAALHAYRHAEQVMATADPGCGISWTMLAAIGRVESNHGRFGGAQLGSDGVSRPEIRGPRLDGAGAFAAIADSDHGVLDHDKVWDRAVGQMQFLPQTWHAVARDGDGDGTMNPDDIDDSALGAAVYLCGAGGSLADRAGMARAAFRYNHSDYYVQLVLSFQTGYQTGVFAVPSPPPPPAKKPAPRKRAHAGRQDTRPRHTVTRPHQGAAHPKPAVPATPPPSSATPRPVPKPTPKPAPKPSPTPSPAAPKLERVDGTWQACGPAFCLDSTVLDLGPPSTWGDRADADFDGDNAVEPNGQEFAGLVGQQAALQVERHDGSLVVYLIGGQGFRNADGTFARDMPAGLAATPSP